RERHVFCGGHHFQRQGCLTDEVASRRTNDVHPDDALGPNLHDHFHETIGLGDAHGPAEHGEREAPRFYLEALLFGLRLGQTHTGDLRVCEDDARNRDPVLGGSFAGDHFGANLALLGGFVSQHGRPADIPDGENAFDVRLTQLVGLNEASGIDLDSELLQSKPSRARLHAYRDQHHVARELLSLAIPGGRDHQRTVRLTLVALGARVLQHGTPVLDDLTFYDFDAI